MKHEDKRKETNGEAMKVLRYVIVSALFVAGYDIYFFETENALGYESIFNVMLFAMAYLLQQKEEKIDKRTRHYALFFSAPFSFALVLGRFLYYTNNLNIIVGSMKGMIAFAISFLGFTVVFRAAGAIVFDRFFAGGRQSNRNSRVWKTVQVPQMWVWGFIIVCWIPVFLAFYPGICSYDSNSQTTQVMQGIAHYTKYHPPLHTLIWAGCFKIGNFLHLHPLCVYSLLQMFLLAFVLSKMIAILMQHGLNNLWIFFGIFWVSVNPIMAIFSLEMTKDAFLAIFFVLISLYLLELAEDAPGFLSRRWNWVKTIMTLLILCLLRNNMVYSCILCMPIAAILMKKYWKQIVTLFMAPLLCCFLINDFVYAQMGIAGGNAREGLSVPIQQIAYTVKTNEENISIEEQKIINKYMPYDEILTLYNPRFSDPVKFSFITDNYEKDKAGFWKLWFELLRKYPKEYINAFLTLNLPYWYPDACSIDYYSDRQFVEVGMDSGSYYSIETDSKLPEVYSFYLKFANFEAFRNVPIISRLYLLSTPIWVLFLALTVLLLKREREKILVLLPSICLWITYMAGPVSNFRYIFPIFAIYPLLAGVIADDSLAAL